MDTPQSIVPEAPQQSSNPAHPQRPTRLGPAIAIVAGVLLGIFFGGILHANAAWRHFAAAFASSAGARNKSMQRAAETSQLDGMKPQTQAEVLLEQAVGNSDGAVEQISTRVDRWRGHITWDSQIASLSTAALNSNDMRTRESGVEVELAAYGLSKTAATVDQLAQQADSSDHAQKIWALWALGLMANRGVEPERVVQTLSLHFKDSDEEARRWSVEGLALSGSTLALAPLLRSMHDDPSPAVRERAACGLAQSGMFTQEQRLTAVPQLLHYSDDPALDAQTHAWAFQALGEITHQHLPNDSAAWRSWYELTKSE